MVSTISLHAGLDFHSLHPRQLDNIRSPSNKHPRIAALHNRDWCVFFVVDRLQKGERLYDEYCERCALWGIKKELFWKVVEQRYLLTSPWLFMLNYHLSYVYMDLTFAFPLPSKMIVVLSGAVGFLGAFVFLEMKLGVNVVICSSKL